MQLPKVVTRDELRELDDVVVKEKSTVSHWFLCEVWIVDGVMVKPKHGFGVGDLVIEDEDGYYWPDSEIEKIVLLERSENNDVV